MALVTATDSASCRSLLAEARAHLTQLQEGMPATTRVTVLSRAAWAEAVAHAQREIARLEAELVRAEERDRLSVERGRPVGCWCLGLGGRGTPIVVGDVRWWTEPCGCPEGRAAERARAQATAAIQRAHTAAIAAARAPLPEPERLRRAAIPREFQDYTLESYPDAAARARQLTRLRRFGDPAAFPVEEGGDGRRARRGRGAYLHGPPGRGKTSLACAALRLWIAQGGTGFFIVPGVYLEGLRAGFDGDVDLREHAQRLRDHVYHAGLLVIDDLGVEKPSAWVREQLFLLLNARLSERLPTIITSNFVVDEMARRLCAGGRGDPPEPPEVAARLVSRLVGMCEEIGLHGGRDLRTIRIDPAGGGHASA